jgi:hypothetical protein
MEKALAAIMAATALATGVALTAEQAQEVEEVVLLQVEEILGHYAEMGSILEGIGNYNEEEENR